MQALHSHVVKANISIHEIQGQLPHTVQTNAPTYMPFSSGMRDQVHSALDHSVCQFKQMNPLGAIL
jgi:hypothetical protein